MENKNFNQLEFRVSESTGRLVGVGNRLIEAIDKSSLGQEKHQKAIIWLTVVIAFSTVVYTGVTIWSTLLQHKQYKLNQNNVEQIHKGHDILKTLNKSVRETKNSDVVIEASKHTRNDRR